MSNNTRKYVKLGIHASSFYSPGTKFKLIQGEVLPLPNNYTRDGLIMGAISGGHLVMASEAEAKEFEKNQAKENTETETQTYFTSTDTKEYENRIFELESKLAETTAGMEHSTKVSADKDKAIELLEAGKTNVFKFDEAGLDSYIKENYDLSKNDVKAYDKMTFEEKQAYAYDLEKNSEEEAG